MSNPPTEAEMDFLAIWPDQRAAAKMLGVSESQLADRDLESELGVTGRRHYRPSAVLEAGAIYKHRSLNSLAAELLAHAEGNGPAEHLEPLRAEIDQFFVARAARPVDRERFRREARRALPTRLFEEVERAFAAGTPLAQPELRGAEVDVGAADQKRG